MSNESELRAITEQITDIRDTNSQILKELTGLSTSFHYMKEKIDGHAIDMDSMQSRVRANEMNINTIMGKLDQMQKSADRLVNPVIRYGVIMIMSGLATAAAFIIKGM